MKLKVLNIILIFTLVSCITSCNKSTSLKLSEAKNKIAFEHLDSLSAFVIFSIGDFEEMSGDVDMVLANEYEGWANIEKSIREKFKSHFDNSFKSQVHNENWIVFREATYFVLGANKVFSGSKLMLTVKLGDVHYVPGSKDCLLREPVNIQGVQHTLLHRTVRLDIDVEITEESNDQKRTIDNLLYSKVCNVLTNANIEDFGTPVTMPSN